MPALQSCKGVAYECSLFAFCFLLFAFCLLSVAFYLFPHTKLHTKENKTNEIKNPQNKKSGKTTSKNVF